MPMFNAGDIVTVDGGQQARVEKNVGGEDYIVRTVSGNRVAIAGFRLRAVPKPTPVATPVVETPTSADSTTTTEVAPAPQS